MFDYTLDLPSETEYMIDLGYNEAYIYKINHKNKTMQTHRFNCSVDVRDYIFNNKIKSVVFYCLGDLAPLKYDLENHWVECLIDREIYKWRMNNLSPNERNRTTPLYYYEVQGYKYDQREVI